jgi:tRNA-specific 2-thiouridylase
LRKRVIVGVSGGMDSSVALYLLKEEGYEPLALTLYLYDEDPRNPRSCCNIVAIGRARRFAKKMGVPHLIVDLRKEFQRKIIGYFVEEYKRGRTPNPCALCNRDFKFHYLLKKADEIGAEFVATGHYARVEGGDFIKRARDKKKDQSYYLVFLKRNWIPRILFPLGEMEKEEVKKIASTLGVESLTESQELCFLDGGDYREFLKKRIEDKPGEIVDLKNNVLGKHRGISYFTVGQRKKLGISAGVPLYVVSLDYRNNRVIVGTREETLKRKIRVSSINWFKEPEGLMRLKVKIRHLHNPSPAQVMVNGSEAIVTFDEPQFAPTPGQVAALYEDDILIGGGIIEEIMEG